MPLTTIQFKPGVIKDDPEDAIPGFATDSEKIRWVRGSPQALGGTERAGTDAIPGITRSLYSYTTTEGDTYGIFGSSSKLVCFDGVRVWNITPIRATGTLGTDPITTTAGGGAGQTVTVTVTDTAHGALLGDTVYFRGVTGFDNITIGVASGTLGSNPFTTTENSRLVVVTDTAHGLSDGDIARFTGASAVGGITIGGSASGTAFGASPFATTENEFVVVITLSSHPFFDGDTITISSASAVGGITLDGDYVVTVADANTISVVHTSAATSTATGGGSPTYSYERPYSVWVLNDDSYLIMHPEAATSGADGGGASVAYEYSVGYEITAITDADNYTISVAASGAQAGTTGGGSSVEVEYEINVGLTDGIGGKGFGLGGFGQGGFGLNEPDEDVTNPRVWAIDSRGDYAYAAPLGGTIYEWTRYTSYRAKALSNAPARVNWFIVTDQLNLMAFGCTSVEGKWQPMLMRHSDATNPNVWTPNLANTAGDLGPLGAGSFYVAAYRSRTGILAWTNTAQYGFTYTGQLDRLYQETLLGVGCGLIGPNAVVVDDGQAIWISPQRSFFIQQGGAPQHLLNPNRQWFEEQMPVGQNYKVFAEIDNLYHGIFFFFPTSQTGDCDTYLRWDSLEDPNGFLGWSNGTWDRTAWLDNLVFDKPIAVASDGKIYYHEQGLGENGDAVTRSITFAPIEAEDGDATMDVSRGLVSAKITGTLYLTGTFKYWPPNPDVVKGPFTLQDNIAYPTANSRVVDMDANGRQLQLKYESSGATDFWRVVRTRLDIAPGSAR